MTKELDVVFVPNKVGTDNERFKDFLNGCKRGRADIWTGCFE